MFKLHSLGWHSFQQLCLAVVRENLGQSVEAFLDTNDGGRDGAFAGTWQSQGGEDLKGQFVIQCKFTSRPGYSLKPSDMQQEILKARKLVDQGRCEVYVLMTNAGISGRTERAIAKNLKSAGVQGILVLGSTWIEQQIRESKRLRMMVPRIYGLGDLSQILDERAYAQATAVLESMREELAKVVVTETYRKAAHALDRHGFVLLVGEPAAGKTTIASMLAMASADQWGASVMKLDHPGSVVAHWNPHEPSQFFWMDDAFGVTQYESSLVMAWNHALPHMKALLKQGGKVVMTSRDYIYNRARQELKEGAFPLFQESQVVIDVHDLSQEERRQILYNHLKLGGQPRKFLVAVKPHLESVANHARFIPEIARRLGDEFFTRKLPISRFSLGRFVEKREEFLIDVCKGLDSHSKAALALLYMRSGRLPSPIELTAAEAEALQRMNSNLGACSAALDALKGSLVSHTAADGESFWSFRHPTIGDAYSAILRASPELLGIFLHGTDVDKLMEQTTCGDMQIEQAIVVPKSMYALMVERLNSYKTSPSYKSEFLATWGAERNLHSFLARRCDRAFLEMFLAQAPQIMSSISQPSLYLEYSSAVRLAIRLYGLDLLPDAARKLFASTVTDYALQGQDASVLRDPDIRALLTEMELEELKGGILVGLVPRLGTVRSEVQTSHQAEDAPEDHMRYFLEVLDGIEQEFVGDATVYEAVEQERLRARAWIDENPPEVPEQAERQLTIAESAPIQATSRSVFDDIEE